MTTVQDEKRTLRRALRERRLDADPHALAAADARIVERLCSLWNGETNVALFWPMLERGEVDLRAFDTFLRERGVQPFYPWIPNRGEDGARTFRRLASVTELVRHPLGMAQPPHSAVTATALDFIVVPALGATSRGARLGYGAGDYDRYLAQWSQAGSVVVVRHAELLAELPLEAHDQLTRWVVTDEVTLGPLR